MSDNDKTRRRFLALTGSTAAAALAGCSGEDGTGEATGKEDMTEESMETETESMDG